MTSLSCIRNVDTTVQSNPESHYDCSLIKDTMLFVFSPSQFYILPDGNTLKEIRGSITFEDVGDQVEDRLVVNAIDSILRSFSGKDQNALLCLCSNSDSLCRRYLREIFEIHNERAAEDRYTFEYTAAYYRNGYIRDVRSERFMYRIHDRIFEYKGRIKIIISN